MHDIYSRASFVGVRLALVFGLVKVNVVSTLYQRLFIDFVQFKNGTFESKQFLKVLETAFDIRFCFMTI